ncbi:uncharacterized protein LOC117303960 [Asterias rubens]|uniref:uncharacterized protein LOC117303960 n=1 Tax=Asterias rubens TaxID=7604 RepID=UPI001454FC2D|nr:uncharacterized protein LOC117303960 [Asterias rubens]
MDKSTDTHDEVVYMGYNQIVLKFYKGQDQLLSGKELRREQIVISAENFCGVESCIRHPKNPFVLTIVCINQIVLLSFACHSDLLDWFYKTHNTLGSVTTIKCKINIPNGSRLRAGPGLLYFHDNHFAITDDVPSQLIGGWSLANLTRYGLIDEGFAFEVRSDKDGGAFVVLTEQGETLKSHFDAATYSSSNRWSHVSSTVSIHEELIPRRRNFSEEVRHLISGVRKDDNTSDDAGNGHGGSQAGNSCTAQANSAAFLEQCSHRNNTCNNRNQTMSHLHRNDSLGRNVEMVELDHSGLAMAHVGYGGGSSSGSSVETIFNNCDSLRSPKKTTPIREQNYEIMASFNHLREHEDTSNGNDPHMGELHEACSICHGGRKPHGVDSDKEENEYVNLPPPKNKKLKPQGSADGLMQLSEDRPEASKSRTPKFSSNAAHARTMSLPLNEDYLLMKYNENGNSKPGTSKASKGRSLSVHPSMERSDSLPPPFDNLVPASTLHGMLQELPDAEKATNERGNDIPVPFQHGDLVKPVGPIAMLRLNSISSSSNESVSSACDSLLDARTSRGASFSRPRQSSIGSTCQRAFCKRQSHSQDERSSSPPLLASTISSRSSDPDFQSRLLSQKDEDPEAFIYVRKGSVERRPESRRPESPISSAPSVTSYITRRRQSLQRAEGSIDDPKVSLPEDKSIDSYTRRKRCNTDPSLSFSAVTDGTVWSRDPNDDEDDTDGYLIMKPVYEEKLKRFQARKFSSPVLQGVPQSPLHSNDKLPFVQAKLKRSATVSGEVSSLSPRPNHRTMSLRERPPRVTGTPPRDRKSSMSFMERFMRKRGNSAGVVKVDSSRPRHKHNYASIDPGDVVRQSRRASAQPRMQNPSSSTEVDILDDPDFNDSVSNFIQENPPSMDQDGYLASTSAPSSMQFNQIEASKNTKPNRGQDGGIHFTADVDTVVFSQDRKTESSDEYRNL